MFIRSDAPLRLKPDPKQVGKYLRNLRLNRGMTLREVQEITNISNAYLSQIERGKRGIPRSNFLMKLAEAYGIKWGEMFIEIEENCEPVLRMPSGEPVKPKPPIDDFILKYYNQLNEENKHALHKFLRYLHQEQTKSSK